MKTLYVVEEDRINGDSYVTIVTFDKGEALAKAEYDWDHLTSKEKEKYSFVLRKYKYEGDRTNPKEAWDELNDDVFISDELEINSTTIY